MTLDLALIVFPHVDAADHAFADASQAGGNAAWLREAAVVEHHRRDRISVRGTVAGHYVDEDDEGDAMGKSTVEGALTGAVAGAVFGPAGMAAGFAAGGTIGGVAQADSAPHNHSALFDELRADVPEKSSAIVLLAAPAHVDRMVAAFEGRQDAKLIRHGLSDEAAASLQAAVAQSPAVLQGGGS
ncbi:MAG TPA: DUF1269 domain-containing protein [Thermoleophilaceae bacterium]